MLGLLRWLVGVSSALALALFLAIMVLGKGLASAYQSGAGTQNLIKSVAPVAIGVLLAAMLATAFLPNARAFLHVVAVLVILAIAGCIGLLRGHPGEAMLYIGFLALWLCYYAAVLAGWR